MQPEERGHRAIDAGCNIFGPPSVFQGVGLYPGRAGRPDDKEDVMNRNATTRIMIGGLAALLMTFAAISAAAPRAQDAAKTYEKFLGKYEFDLASMGGGTRIFEYYVKDNAFWIEYGFTSPGELKPVDSTVDQFTFTDPDDGLIKVTFQKDGDGNYTICRVVADSLGLDIVGTKQK